VLEQRALSVLGVRAEGAVGAGCLEQRALSVLGVRAVGAVGVGC
jgi:hypothetical protein